MRKILFIPLFIFILLFTGCGTDIDSPTGEIIAPPGSEIVINPSSLTVNDSSSQVSWHYTTFIISVIDSQGKPIGRVKMKISFPWAVPNSNLVQLYDGFCSNTNPPTNSPKNSPMDAVTDDYGIYNLCVGYSSGQIRTDSNGDPIYLEYSGDISVSSGTAYGSAKFEVAGPK